MTTTRTCPGCSRVLRIDASLAPLLPKGILTCRHCGAVVR